MRINITLLVIGLMNSAAATAQPTLLSTTSTPAAGLQYTAYRNQGFFAQGNAGPAQNWDFSTGIISIKPTVINYASCPSGFNCSSYPGATLEQSSTPAFSAKYNYYSGSTAALSIVGASDSNLAAVTVYSNPDDILRFPMTYGTSYVDSFVWAVTYSSGTYTHIGSDSVIADGWGTLTTPAGTFQNTLRVKRIISGKSAPGACCGAFKYIIYTWYDVAHKDYLLLSNTSVDTSSGQPIVNMNSITFYTGVQSTNVGSVPASNISWQLVPNPAVVSTQASFFLPAAADITLTITDITGHNIRNIESKALPAGDNKITLPIDKLPAGVYIIRLASGSSASYKKLVVQ